MHDDKNISEHDQKLIDRSLEDATIAFEKRDKEFFELLGIPVLFTATLQDQYLDYLVKAADKRPFARSPLARESFFAGYWFAIKQGEKNV
ncbi:MAG TPA: hypothetical protein VIJ14_09670 [Rhabdochlamydiaceae bacterium]